MARGVAHYFCKGSFSEGRVGASAKEAEAASAFIKYLLTPEAARAIKAKGMEPGSE